MMSDEWSESCDSVETDELVVRAKTDRAAFSLLYERFYPDVARYCLRRLFVRTVAEDIVSDVFLEIASHLPGFPGQTTTDFRRWLFRIATNAINAYFRKSRRREELLAEAVRASRLNTVDRSAADVDFPDWPEVYQAIMTLDERDRTIVMLRFFSECSHDEIAQIVEMTPGAVRTILSRTLARLRMKFKEPITNTTNKNKPSAG